MKNLGFAMFSGFFLLKVEMFGVNAAGALTVGQLLLAYALDRWKARRDIQRFPYLITYTDDGRLVWTPKETTRETT